jgi:hypothetical protein
MVINLKCKTHNKSFTSKLKRMEKYNPKGSFIFTTCFVHLSQHQTIYILEQILRPPILSLINVTVFIHFQIYNLLRNVFRPNNESNVIK